MAKDYAVTRARIPAEVRSAVDTAIEAQPDRDWHPGSRSRQEIYRRQYDAGLQCLADGWISVCQAMVASATEDRNPLSAKWVRDTLFGPPSQRLAIDKTNRQVIEVRVRDASGGPTHLLAPAPPEIAEYTDTTATEVG